LPLCWRPKRSRSAFEGEPTFDKLAEDYLKWCESRGVSARTIRGYMERLRNFGRFIHQGVAYGDRRARDFRPADLRRIIAAMRAEGRASTWVRDVSSATRACFAWAARRVDDRTPERILAEVPFVDLEKPRVEAPPKRYAGADVRAIWFRYAIGRTLTLSPAERLARRFDAIFIAMCRFLEASGARPDEACRLEWSHIDWEARIASLRGKSTRSTGKKRKIPLTPDVLEMLRRIQSLPERHPVFVFTHKRRVDGNATLEGDPWTANALSHKFAAWRDDAMEHVTEAEAGGLASLTPYQLRRDLGADILRATGSYAQSAEVLGHSVAMNERHYSSFEDEKSVLVAEVAAKARRKGKPSEPHQR
jgi:integrase